MTHPTYSEHPASQAVDGEASVTDVAVSGAAADPDAAASTTPPDTPTTGDPDDRVLHGQSDEDGSAGEYLQLTESSVRNKPMPAAVGIDDESDTGSQAEPPRRGPADGHLAPGATVDDPVAALWGTDLVQRYREQWQQLQLRFVDDPHAATEDAARVLDEVVQSLTHTLTEQKRTLDTWQHNNTERGTDTEVLRTALTRYRDFLDRLLGL